jgi:hypothetical protein
MEKAEGVGLQNLPQVHHPPQLFTRDRDAHGQDFVAGFCRSQQVTHGANATDAGGNARHFPHGPAFAEFFKSAKFNHMKVGIFNLSRIIQKQGDFGMTFNAGDRINNQFRTHNARIISEDYRSPMGLFSIADFCQIKSCLTYGST